MMKRLLATALLFSLGLPVAAMAQAGTEFGGSKRFQARKPKLMAADLLLKTADQVDWEDSTFDEILDWLRAESEDQINVIPRWNALAVVGVDGDSPVTLKLSDTTIAEVLNEVLDQLLPGGGLGYQAKTNALRISTLADFNRKLEVRTYNILDMVFDMPDFGQSFPTVDLQAAARSGGSGGSGGGGQSVFRGSSSSSDELEIEDRDIEEAVDGLITLIATVIEPASWGVVPTRGTSSSGPVGGTGPGVIRAYNNRTLVIYNTIEVHEKIAGYFSTGE